MQSGRNWTMNDIDPRYHTLNDLHEAGRFDDALALSRDLFAEAEAEPRPERYRYFMPMFQLQLLLDVHAPTRAVLAALRDEQAARLLDGDAFCGSGGPPAADEYQRASRFSLLLQMNTLLGEMHATHALFRALEARLPELARQYAHQALPAMVDAGDFALADRYRGDPLSGLANVNHGARELPLFPPPREAPRLAADLSNLVKDVRIGIAVLRGLGDPAAADALRAALLDGLESDELREMAARELAEPGTITREGVARQMAEEERQGL